MDGRFEDLLLSRFNLPKESQGQNVGKEIYGNFVPAQEASNAALEGRVWLQRARGWCRRVPESSFFCTKVEGAISHSFKLLKQT